MADRITAYIIPNQRVNLAGWCSNPLRPIEVRRCPTHGEYRDYGRYRRCSLCRMEQSRRARESRRPPRLPFDGKPGHCRLCGSTELPPRRRTWCSPECVWVWNLAVYPAMAIRHLADVHGQRCAECDRSHVKRSDYLGPITLELEHVRPLWSLTDSERLELRWWLPFNLQLLCTDCHRAKTRHEAGQRAAIRRGDTDVFTPWPGLSPTVDEPASIQLLLDHEHDPHHRPSPPRR